MIFNPLFKAFWRPVWGVSSEAPGLVLATLVDETGAVLVSPEGEVWTQWIRV